MGLIVYFCTAGNRLGCEDSIHDDRWLNDRIFFYGLYGCAIDFCKLSIFHLLGV
jgi:hypothetical protein